MPDKADEADQDEEDQDARSSEELTSARAEEEPGDGAEHGDDADGDHGAGSRKHNGNRAGRFAGAPGWNDWVRRNFSPEGRLQSARSRRATVGSATAREASGLSASARSEATRKAVNGLDRRELRIGIVATVAEVGLTGLVTIPYLLHHHPRTASNLKTLNAVHLFLIEGIVLGAFLLLGTLLKRRALLGFASLLVGVWLLQIKALAVLGIAFLGFGLWLVIKALKVTNKEGRGAGRGSARGTAEKSTPAKPSRASAASLGDRSAPKPNKRYTPPKPSRPAPKKRAPARAEPPKH
jgi:hypothetical protein